jgi:hypothetical protein
MSRHDNIIENGFWTLSVKEAEDGEGGVKRSVAISSDDFTHDASFAIVGDFADFNQRVRYHQEIANRLNAFVESRNLRTETAIVLLIANTGKALISTCREYMMSYAIDKATGLLALKVQKTDDDYQPIPGQIEMSEALEVNWLPDLLDYLPTV